MWAVLDPDGTLRVREDEATGEALEDALHGYAETMPSPDPNLNLFINETRLDEQGQPLRMNPKATAFLTEVLWPGQRVVGPLVITGLRNNQGVTPLTEEQVAELTEHFNGGPG